MSSRSPVAPTKPRRLACVTMDIELDQGPGGQIRLFDQAAKLDWFLEALAGVGAKLTGFMVMNQAKRFKPALEIIRQSIPLEIGVHSFSHNPAEAATSEEVARATNAYQDLWGSAPLGYRAPIGLIDGSGVGHLITQGYRYDSSIFPTRRRDEFAANRLHFPRTPFIFDGPHGRLLELPIATLRGVRLPLTLSFIKLYGWDAYRLLQTVCPLPERVVLDCHPYDFYIGELAQAIPGWKRYAHLRNAHRAPQLFQNLLRYLKANDYEFVLMAELANSLNESDLPTMAYRDEPNQIGF